VLAFCNTELNKLVTQKLRIEIMSLSCHSLCLADVSVCTIAMHRVLAHLVLSDPLKHGSKLVRCPIAVEPVSGLRILHQPIGVPLKVLLLGQIDPVNRGGLLQHLCAKENYIYMSK
jgi:hypothetical protein